jgi:hypothetical protein
MTDLHPVDNPADSLEQCDHGIYDIIFLTLYDGEVCYVTAKQRDDDIGYVRIDKLKEILLEHQEMWI